MARIEGVDLPRNKRIEIALTYIYGIGPTRASKILADTKVNPDIRVKDLTENEANLMPSPTRKLPLVPCADLLARNAHNTISRAVQPS